MFKPAGEVNGSVADRLAAKGYWPAQAAMFLRQGKYSRAVEICRINLPDHTETISGRLVYARALFHAGQTESATEQFYHVLSHDPDNLVALKYMGDIKYTEKDVIGAMAHYERILEIDPHCHGLKSDLVRARTQTTRTITLTRARETTKDSEPATPLRNIPFFTETIGDLYMNQGHPRLAIEVYRTLNESNQNPRLAEKLFKARRYINEKEE